MTTIKPTTPKARIIVDNVVHKSGSTTVHVDSTDLRAAWPSLTEAQREGWQRVLVAVTNDGNTASLGATTGGVVGVATTEPDATVIDEPADPATWVRTYERATPVGEPPPAMAGPFHVGPVSKLREALGIVASATPIDREDAWLQELAEQGVRIVHPDDGWVDREANTVQFMYPTMQHALPAPGVLVALGTPAKWRVVMLKREVRQPVGGSRWAFVEQPAVDRQRPPDADPLTGELPKRAALLAKEIYVDDIIGGIPTVRLTPPDGEPITFSLSAEGARVLGLALLSGAEISKVTGWGASEIPKIKGENPTHYTIGVDHGAGPDASIVTLFKDGVLVSEETQSNLPPAKCSLASLRAAAGEGDLTFTFDDSVLKATLHRASSNEPWTVTVGDPAPHTLAELRRCLDALPIRALLIIPASLDLSVIDAHFAGYFDGGRGIGFPNGSTLKILRGRPEPRQIAGLAIDVALVLTAVSVETLKEIRLALLRNGGTLFAPFEAEPVGADAFFAVASAASAAQASINTVAAACEALKAGSDPDNDVVAPAAAAQRRARAGIPALVLETGGQCPCRECGGVLDVSVHGQDRAIQCSTPSCVRWIE